MWDLRKLSILSFWRKHLIHKTWIWEHLIFIIADITKNTERAPVIITRVDVNWPGVECGLLLCCGVTTSANCREKPGPGSHQAESPRPQSHPQQATLPSSEPSHMSGDWGRGNDRVSNEDIGQKSQIYVHTINDICKKRRNTSSHFTISHA